MRNATLPDANTPAAARPLGPPVHAVLSAVAFACFAGALVTDIIYSRSPDMQWANFSAWLLFVGLVLGMLAAVAGIISRRSNRSARDDAPAWPHSIGYTAVLLLALLNNFVHSRDAWTSVVPTGLILSALTVLAILATALLDRMVLHRIPVRETR